MKKTRLFALVVALILLTLAACSDNTGSGISVTEPSSSEIAEPEPPEISSQSSSGISASEPLSAEDSSASSSYKAESSSKQPEVSQQQSSVPQINNNPKTDGLTPELEKQLSTPDNTEETITECLDYLQQNITEEQHGGMYRTGDARGSGLLVHGGADKNAYILIYAVDKGAVENIIDSYTNQLPEIVILDTMYSMKQLYTIKQELEKSELSPNIDNFVVGYANVVSIFVTGEENKNLAEQFLQTYQYKDAVFVAATLSGDGTAENPLT